MDQSFINQQKEKLAAERQRLVSQRGSLNGEGGPVAQRATFPDYGDKEEDNAAEVAQFQDNLSLTTNLDEQIAGIDRALEQIVSGTYGVCTRCGKPIDEKRLVAVPEAATHTSC